MITRTLRRLLERFTRDTSILRRLPRRFGGRPLYLTGDSALSYLRPNWAAASAALLDAAAKYARGASSVWDVGGNCGVFTFAAAHVAASGAQILSIEADPFLAALLQRSANLPENADPRVHVLCAAVSDREGLARFLIAGRGRSSNALEVTGHRTQADGTRYDLYVPTTTLDLLLAHFRAPDVVKIDVEGAESLVLGGASDLLTTVRPRFYIEVGPQQNDPVTSMFHKYDYRLYDGNADDGPVLNACTFNTLAVPAESPWQNNC